MSEKKLKLEWGESMRGSDPAYEASAGDFKIIAEKLDGSFSWSLWCIGNYIESGYEDSIDDCQLAAESAAEKLLRDALEKFQ